MKTYRLAEVDIPFSGYHHENLLVMDYGFKIQKSSHLCKPQNTSPSNSKPQFQLAILTKPTNPIGDMSKIIEMKNGENVVLCMEEVNVRWKEG